MTKTIASATLAAFLLALSVAGSQAQQAGPAIRIKHLKQDIQVSPDGRRTTTTTTEVQLLTASGVSQLAQMPVRYDGSTDDADVPEAYTLKPDGRKLPVDPTNIITQKLPQTNALVPLYSDGEQKIILFPNVEPGDSLVFTSRITEKTVPLVGQFTLAHYLSTAAEADDASYSVSLPASMQAKVAYREVSQDVSTQAGVTTYRWTFSNPTTKSMPVRIVFDPDQGPHFLVSTFKDYDALAHVYAGIVRPKIAVTPEIQKQADDITAGLPDKKAQARAIYDWVNQHVRYVGIEFGTGTIIPHEANWTLNNAFGDCKDQALLFASLLKAKGIAADLVLLNSGNRYRLSGVPTLGEFNHVIVWLPEFGSYADTTVPGLQFQSLAALEYGKPVLHIVDTGPAQHTIPILAPEQATSSYKVHAVMNSGGGFDVDVSTSATGPWAASLRRLNDAMLAVGPVPAAGALLKVHGFPNATGTFQTVAGSTPAGTFGLTSTFHTGRIVAGGNVLAVARGMRLLDEAGNGPMGALANTTLADTEATPCYSSHQTEDIAIDFSNGQHLADLPTDASIKTDNLSYESKWTVSGNTVTVHREFVSKISEPVCTGRVREETAAALAKIRSDYAQPTRLAAKDPSAPSSAN